MMTSLAAYTIYNLTKSNVTNTTPEHEKSGLDQFSDWYVNYHGYVACIVCVFGTIANILNIIVLTRKNMQSPTNIILTALAVTDGLTMAAYFPFALYFYCLTPSRGILAARFAMFHIIFSVLVHSTSIWLTVTLALFRYLFIKYPSKGAIYCSIHRAKLAVALCVIAVTIACLPNCLRYELSNDGGGTYWSVRSKNNTDTDVILDKVNFWSQGILVKLIPCIFLTVLSIVLVNTMKAAERRHKTLLMKSHKIDEDNRRERKTNRTTRMLLAVVILFLITETPQGILHILNGTIDGFMNNVYQPLGDLLDIVALINNGINFVLYCTMSKQFRDTFVVIFFNSGKYLRANHLPTHASTRDTDV